MVEHIPSEAYVDVYQIRATSDLKVKPHGGTHPIWGLCGCASDQSHLRPKGKPSRWNTSCQGPMWMKTLHHYRELTPRGGVQIQ